MWELSKVAAASLKTKLKPHQQRVVDRLQGQSGLVVAHGLGSGKTLSSIAAAAQLSPDGTHVIVPAALRENYAKEIAKHVKGHFHPTIQSIQNAAAHGVDPSELLIVDEAHRARETSSKTFKELSNAKAGKKLLLTASPTYNRPSDISPLVNMVSGKHTLPVGKSFNDRYVKKPSKSVFALFPGTDKKPKLVRQKELSDKLKKWVDYHESSGGDFPGRSDEHISVAMTKKQTHLHDYAWSKLPVMSRLRLRAGLPPDKKDLSKLNAFQSQARQIANSESGFLSEKETVHSPKITTAFSHFHKALSRNPNHKAVVYSNYMRSLDEYKKHLDRHKVPFGEYSGRVSKADRDQMVKDYNSGKLKTLLVSSAGGEGLDLKGTRQVQVLEPHWNNEKLDQVIGRAIRHGSHAHLPLHERHVHVQHYSSHPLGKARNLLGLKPRRGIDQVLSARAESKEGLNNQLRAILKKNQSVA